MQPVQPQSARLPQARDVLVPGTVCAVAVEGRVAGILLAREQGWRFCSAHRRFDVLDGGVYCRAEDAMCAARGIAALARCPCGMTPPR